MIVFALGFGTGAVVMLAFCLHIANKSPPPPPW